MHNRRSVAIQRGEQLHDLLGLAGMQIAGGFVGQQQRRLVDDRPGNADQLLLPAGELIGIQVLLGDDLKMVERFGHHALSLTAWDVLVRQRKIDVFLHRQVVEQVVTLKDHSDIALGQFGAIFALHRVHAFLAKPVFARPLIVKQSEHVQQR